MSDVRHVEKSAARMKKPESPELPAYNPMDTAPLDGKAIIVTDGKDRTETVVWRTTRQFDRKIGIWSPTAFWACHNSGGRKLEFEPQGWMKAW